MTLAKALAEHLGAKIENNEAPLIRENEWGAGCTETGFSSTYSINIAELEREIDAFITTFQKKAA